MFKIKSIERKPMTSKAGKHYTQLVVNTEDGRRASGFGNKSNESWATGYTVKDTEAVIVQNGKYYNIEMVEKPKVNQVVEAASKVIDNHFAELNRKLDEINNRLIRIENKMSGIEEDGIRF